MEWTSSQNRRCINVNLHDHGGLHYNLGLIRVTGSAPAQVIDDLVRERLCDFGIYTDQLVGITSDGASVMIAYGRLTECEHVVCYAHRLHLAVQDMFYTSTTTSENDLSQNTEFESDGECNSSDENSEYDYSTMIEFGDRMHVMNYVTPESIIVFNENDIPYRNYKIIIFTVNILPVLRLKVDLILFIQGYIQ